MSASVPATSAAPASFPEDAATAATVSWRLWPGQWRGDQAFAGVRQLLRTNNQAADEVAFFLGECECHHGMRNFAIVRADAELLKDRIQSLRADGIASVGINLLPAFSRAGVPDDRPMPCQPIVNAAGKANSRSGCPQDPEVAAVAHERARLAATCGPDFIWVDDHCRMRDGCFCPRCVRGFQQGAWSDRACLVAALDDPEAHGLRLAWIRYTAKRLRDFCSDQRAAVDAVAPDIAMGFMMVGGDIDSACGTYVRDCCQALRATKVRPGHGWYQDDQRLGLLRKTLEDARTVAMRLPAGITDIQHEYETWPGGSLDKGVRSSVLEITNALAAGCTGVAMNARHAMGPPSQTDERLHAGLHAHRGLWDRLVQANHGLSLQGMYLPQAEERLARMRVGKGGITAADRRLERDAALADRWYAHGVAPAVDPAHACGTFLPASAVECLDDQQLEQALSGFAVLDGDAVKECHRRGFGHLVGASAGDYQSSVHQRLTDHPLNGADAGAEHVDPAPWDWPLSDLDPRAEVLGELLDLHHQVIGASLIRFENERGGRIAAFGWCPWHRLDLPSRWRQLQALLDWGTRATNPVRCDRLVRVLPWWRCTPDASRGVLVLSNLALDDTGALHVRVRTPAGNAELLAADGSGIRLPTVRSEDDLVIGPIDVPAWSASAILIG